MGVRAMATPICRCRVLYLGSAVPHITKDGLQGIQEPLRELYPDPVGSVGARGIDSWLSVWSNGLLLENVDEHGKRVTRFFPVETLHYCAAVRHVVVPGADGERVPRFLPLDSPFARLPTVGKPPLFACILRRTTGIKVLECHAFICKKEMAANALVRCCFHSYADNMYARQLENGGTATTPSPSGSGRNSRLLEGREWRAEQQNGEHENADLVSIYTSDENHKIWASPPTPEASQTLSSVKSVKSVDSVTTLVTQTPTSSGKTSRPRQMVGAKPPPPPEPPIEDKPPKPLQQEPRLNTQSRARTRNGHQQQQQQHNLRHHHHHPQHPQQHHHQMPPQMPPHPVRGPPMMPGPMPGPMPVPMGRPYPPPPFMMARSAEEPTYMPSARPMSPVASYQPAAFPYDRYYMQRAPSSAGTNPRPPSALHRHKHHHHPHHPHQHPHPKHPQQPDSAMSTFKSTNGKRSKQPSPSSAGKQQQHQQQPQQQQQPGGDKTSSDSESKYSTGIYRKKGHLNERAFSYSIRQEHRSRSHSSLATLTFQNGGGGGSPVSNGGGSGSHHTPSPVNNNSRVPSRNNNNSSNGSNNGQYLAVPPSNHHRHQQQQQQKRSVSSSSSRINHRREERELVQLVGEISFSDDDDDDGGDLSDDEFNGNNTLTNNSSVVGNKVRGGGGGGKNKNTSSVVGNGHVVQHHHRPPPATTNGTNGNVTGQQVKNR